MPRLLVWALVLYVDSPVWPGKGRAAGRLWAHLISDVSYEELHVFAAMLGAPRRGFDRDHYDIPAAVVPAAVWLGASYVSSRDIAGVLARSGLRRPKHLFRADGLGVGNRDASEPGLRR